MVIQEQEWYCCYQTVTWSFEMESLEMESCTNGNKKRARALCWDYHQCRPKLDLHKYFQSTRYAFYCSQLSHCSVELRCVPQNRAGGEANESGAGGKIQSWSRVAKMRRLHDYPSIQRSTFQTMYRLYSCVLFYSQLVVLEASTIWDG